VECLDDNIASEFVSGSLPKLAITKVETHLATCRDCRMLVATLAADTSDSQAETREHAKAPSSSSSSAPNLGAVRVYNVGDRVGRYLVLSTLGAGGMGVVVSAYDPQLDRKVALKLLRGNLGVTTKEARARLRREAQAIAQLNHPNVVGVYDVGTTDDNDLYIAMEFVEGDTVSRWLKAWPRTWREKLEIFLQAARGLYAAHSVGLLHRDFKPDNVLVGGDGRVRVTDFGLARSLLGLDAGDDPARSVSQVTALQTELTATGTVLGTPRYMPPEQLVGPDIDARSDQFSFCVALYEALYGNHPLAAQTAVGMLERGERAQPAPTTSDVPVWVGKVVARGLERERNKRYPTMAELMAELVPAPVRSRARLAAVVAGAVVVVGGSTAAALEWGVRTPEPLPHLDPWAIDELNKLKGELREMAKQRDQLEEELERSNLEKDKLVAVAQDYELKKQQVDTLVREVVQLQAQVAAAPRPLSVDAVVSRAVEDVAQPIRGCFLEWTERHPLQNARVVVRLVVGKEGKARDAHGEMTGGLPPDGVETSECVAFDVEAARFPYAQHDLEVEVTAAWTGGNLTLSTGVRPYVSLLDLP
jgi:serine/threonine protein kinase